MNSEIDGQTNRFTSSTNITYDAAGRITTDQKFKDMPYQYDAHGRVRLAQKLSDNSEASVVYDGLGQRVGVREANVRRYVVYDIFGQMVAEYGGAAKKRGRAWQ